MKIKLFLLLMCLPAFLFSQGGSLTKLGEWGASSYWDVFVKDNYAYCAANGGGVDILDISTISNPKRIATINASNAFSIYVADDYMYVAQLSKGISIYNISNLTSPKLEGTFTSRNVASVIRVYGQYAYVINNYLDVSGSYGELLILDISSPSTPVQVSKYNSDKFFTDFSLKGSYVYASASVFNPFAPTEDGWLVVLDISDITSPKKVGVLDTPGEARGIFISGNYAYLAEGTTGLQIVDISAPTTPSLAGNVDTPGYFAQHVQTVGNIAYVANGEEGLAIIDVSDPENPTFISEYGISWEAEKLVVMGNYAYIASTFDGLTIVDISTPASPALAGKFDQSVALSQIKIKENYAFIGSNDGMQVMDISDPSNPSFLSYYRSNNWKGTYGHDINGDRLYLLNSEGMEIVDISNPVTLQKKGDLALLPSDDICVQGNLVYIIESFHGLSIYDVSDPANIIYKGALTTEKFSGTIFVSENIAYITGDDGLYIVDVSDPSSPSILTLYNENRHYLSVFVQGNYAYLTGSSLSILDISNPALPSQVFTFEQFQCRGIYVEGKYAYVAALSNGIRIFDISNPTAIVLVGSYTADSAGYVMVKDNIIYAVYSPSGKLFTLLFSPPPRIGLDKTMLNFSAATNGWVSNPQAIYLNNTGSGTLSWTTFTSQQWLHCTPEFGTDSYVLTVSVKPEGLTAGTYEGTITVSAPDAVNSPETINVSLNVSQPSALNVPFGEFATPVDNTMVQSSIPVTGWALDDIGVQSVKIYRGTGNNLVFIGDAIFVEGARPDVQAAYPEYPNSSKAGWGYMLLTNFLPDGGNGSFTLHAIARDIEGNEVSLGTKVIHCDNINAIKPFGAIDTPIQGGAAQGDQYVNFGWALTPQPNIIPMDGSTIDVWVDGVNLGHPVYNKYRSDIATLFPGYANSDGAVGYYILDTEKYDNGVHTIQWTVKDSAGNTDGVGSRYFIVQNYENRNASAQRSTAKSLAVHSGYVKPYTEPVRVKKGFDRNAPEQLKQPDEQGIVRVQIRELERLELNVFAAGTDKRLLIPGGTMPAGSSLEPEKGIYRWMPGPGFIGLYHLILNIKKADNTFRRLHLEVMISEKIQEQRLTDRYDR